MEINNQAGEWNAIVIVGIASSLFAGTVATAASAISEYQFGVVDAERAVPFIFATATVIMVKVLGEAIKEMVRT